MQQRRWVFGLALALLVSASHWSAADEATTAPASGDHLTATFSMYCYWTGEATLGRVDGVIASRIGHWGGSEIVQVDFDPAETDVAKLQQALVRQNSFHSVVVSTEDAGASSNRLVDTDDISLLSGGPHFIEPKHSLRTRHAELASLDLSEAQAMALNSWSYFGGTMPDVLTAEQKRRLADR